MHAQINEIYGYLHGLWRYRWSALSIAWVVAVAGWLVVYGLPNQYETKAAVHIDTTSIMQPLLQGLSVDTDPTEELNLMTRVLLSRENLLSVIREADMDHGAQTQTARERLAAGLAKTIVLENPPAPGTRRPGNIYEISYESTSPEQAFKVVSALLNTLIENTLKSGRTETVMAQEFLDEQIREYEKRLTAAEELLVEFKKKNVGFMPDEKGDYYARVRHAQDAIDATKASLRSAKHRYAELRKQISGESPMLASGGAANASAARLRQYRAELADLQTQFTNEHPDVQALRAKIATLQETQSFDSATAGTYAGDNDAEFNPVYQELKVQESQARIDVGKLQIQLAEEQASLGELQKSIDVIPQVEANLVKLNRDYEITKERYLNLVERRESARLAQQVEQSSNDITFRVVEAPIVPRWPSGPNRQLYLAGVLVAALGAGAAWSVLMFLLYPTFVDYKQLRKMIDLPVLGAVSLQMTVQQKRHRKLQLRSFLLAMLLLLGFFGGVLWYREPGSTLVRSVISEIGIYI